MIFSVDLIIADFLLAKPIKYAKIMAKMRGGKIMLSLRTCASVWIIALVISSTCFAGNWKSEDIGNTEAGSTKEEGGKITIKANGADIWGSEDGCRFVYQELSGDFEISARVVSLERANEWSKAGLMARQSLDANSPNAFLNVTPDHGVKMIHRDTVGGSTGPSPWEKNAEAPVYLKLVREGNTFTAYMSDDGKTWEEAEVAAGTPSQAEVQLNDPILVGMAVTSHVQGTLTTAVFDNIAGSFLAVEPHDKLAKIWGQIKRNSEFGVRIENWNGILTPQILHFIQDMF